MARTRPTLIANILGGCALVATLGGQPVTADTLGDAKNTIQNAANSVPAPPGQPTQAQIDQAKAQIEQELDAAWSALQQRVSGIVNQQRQQLEQARQAVIAQERATVAQLRSRRPTSLPGTLPSGTTQKTNSPSSTMIGGLSTAGQTTSNLHVGTTSTPTPDALRLDTTTVDGGGPEVSVGLLGAGFTPGCEVHFRVSASRDVAVRPDWSDSGAIGVTLPADLTGLGPYNGVVYVKRDDGQVSSSKPFVFRPRMDVVAVDAQVLHPGCHPSESANYINKVSGWDFRHLSIAIPTSGSDQIASGCRLKNGWVVDHVEISSRRLSMQGGVTVSNLHQDSDDLSFQLQWTTSNLGVLFQSAYGAYQVIARGPAGVPYR